MKNFTLLLSALCLSFVVFTANGQSKKYVLFEHFTQASCGPCASQNPAFEATADNNRGAIHHIAYHTSWPGVDPMYNYVAAENDTRTSYYGVTGVPNMQMLGNTWSGGPASVSQLQIDNAAAPGSPIEIKVDEVTNGQNRDVTITIETTGTAPTGNLVLRAAVVEKHIVYGTPPGTNGELEFPNVFRKMLPSTAGDAYTAASTGNSVTFNYSYALDPIWDANEIYVIAFVQDETTKEVLNSGSTNDPDWVLNDNVSAPVVAGVPSANTNFDFDITNNGNNAENLRVILTHNSPVDWTASFMHNSNTYTDSVDISVASLATENIQLNVTPGSTAAIEDFTITVKSLDNANNPPNSVDYTIISGITDLIISNGGAAALSDANHHSGLAAAGNTAYDQMSIDKFITASSDNQLTGINNLYYNVGWTFPSLTDASVAELQNFMDNGGNMFISGQDLAWDTWNNEGTATTQAFVNNYMHAGYVDDGSAANSPLTAEASDAVFGNVANSNVSDIHSGNIYPDQLSLQNQGQSIFYYNNDVNKTAGIRAHTANYKVVFMGIDMAMVSNSTSDAIIQLSHDWFYGLVSTDEHMQAMLELGQNYPNPGADFTTIPFTQLEENMNLDILDMTGRMVFTQQVVEGTTQIQVNTANLESGMYMYRLVSKSGTVATKMMEVVR
jgi:hypothetical protein